MTVNIQLAFQGGGAKLIPLLAAAEAVQEAESDGLIRVNRVAGTSAGAIVACMYATKEKLHLVRNHIRDKGATYIAGLTPRHASPINPLFWSSIARGKPLISERQFKAHLEQLFKIFPSRPVNISDLRIPTLIMAAELIEQRPHVFDTGSIVEALFHSCGLPFLFKAHKTLGAPSYVDGGICASLPVDALNKYHGDGYIIAIGFKETEVRHSASNLLQFSMSLLNTAMNNSVTNAKASLEVGRLIEIMTPLKTLDFAKALDEGYLTHYYNEVRHEVKGWLEKHIPLLDDASKLKIMPREIAPVNEVLQERLYEVYEAQFAKTRFKLHRISLSAKAYCLLPVREPRSQMWDEVEQRFIFTLDGEPMNCFRIRVTATGESALQGTAEWSVHCANGGTHQHEVIVLPVVEKEQKGKKVEGLSRHVLVFFNPVLQPKAEDGGKEMYTLIQQDEVQNAMIGIRDRGYDHLSITQNRQAPAERVDLVLFVPRETYSKIDVKEKKSPRKELKSRSGRRMTREELVPYGPAPIGFMAIGWTGENLTPGDYFGAEFYVLEPEKQA